MALKTNGGEGWFQDPITSDNIKPHSMFMSIYILHTFMPHMATLTKSYLKESKPQLGALGMAAAAFPVKTGP
ncbi:hypothetical protein L226DRAFT_576546 [Lentinus tigrinus ALCF2SS1-7]|uniref:uncharacterized protein n=1 Tax=Lentinus tigrinus ALCF2SS1-7 TaxID=1328758 RepID=UPI001166330E|nr:hypothetical protein L226DRAFT_576546 [Lentinus tigrinus ALCF2SS1-7]